MSLVGCSGPCLKDTDLANGFGCRLPINNTTGSSLSFTVITSSDSATQPPVDKSGNKLKGACYLYGGFSAGTYEADLGLVYQETTSPEMGWKPYFCIKKGSTEQAITNPDPNYADVKGKNAYKPGDASGVEVIIYPNYQNTKKVRLVTEGQTLHTNQYGGTEPKWLMNIIETKSSFSLNVSSYKLLATAGVDKSVSESSIAKTRASGKFTKIKIASVTPSFLNTEKDYGYATKHTSDSYTLGFCKGY